MKSIAAKKSSAPVKGSRRSTKRVAVGNNRLAKTEKGTRSRKAVATKRQTTRIRTQRKSDRTATWTHLTKVVSQRGGLYSELRTTLQVALFIVGIWSHQYLAKGLFGDNQPAILSTMIPGIEWIMMGFVLRDMMAGHSQAAGNPAK